MLNEILAAKAGNAAMARAGAAEADSVRPAVIIVWIPMLEADDEAAAREAARMFPGYDVMQFFDSTRLAGRTAAREAFPADCLERLVKATPAEHPLHARLEAAARAGEPPVLWDAVLFYGEGTVWGDAFPAPWRWSKQVDFHGPAPEGAAGVGMRTATFLRDSCDQGPVESDWKWEARRIFATGQ